MKYTLWLLDVLLQALQALGRRPQRVLILAESKPCEGLADVGVLLAVELKNTSVCNSLQHDDTTYLADRDRRYTNLQRDEPARAEVTSAALHALREGIVLGEVNVGDVLTDASACIIAYP